MNMFHPLKLAVLLLLFIFSTFAHSKDGNFLVLNYHDIIDEEDIVAPFDRMEVNKHFLEDQFVWLKKNGYSVVSVQAVLDAAAGKSTLPEKAVLLTFDDGYLSFYSNVFPLLKKYHYPASVALVGKWMADNAANDSGKPIMNWDQVREVANSGLVEIASHTYSFHNGILANPQGNTQAATITRLYDDPMLIYENDEQYLTRIRTEMFKSAEFIFQHAGIRPRVMVWPYGEYNATSIAAAKEAGFQITMGLVDGFNTLANLDILHRSIMVDDPKVEKFAELVTGLRSQQSLRVAHIDLDYLFDKDPEQTEKNIGLLIQRIKDMHISTAYLQAYADPDGDGNADELYFPNRHLPVRRDLFNRVAWLLKKKAAVKVYAWLPIMAYQSDDIDKSWYVQEWKDGKAQTSSHIYTRLSPFNPQARQFVAEIYEDLGKYCNFDGVLFHDDGILSDFEDSSPAALAYGKQAWGISDDMTKLRATSKSRLEWAKHKTELMGQFTDELTNRVRVYRPYIQTARNLYALPLLEPYSEEWYAQSFKSFLNHYDYIAIEAMPFMEGAKNPNQWLTNLVKAVAKEPEGLKKTVFELQAVNWKNQQKIPSNVFVEQLTLLKSLGVKHIGYYPDNVYVNQPRLEDLQQHFSLPELQ
ncbi:MAG: poly-beta-1,6-N-acetyl-D-glucosamine N-deacetylase PgaB [Methylococcaceae bacterium]|nr:poly-beta-1,6-N-acetyl-D-glucosamine N-deacetylase PgaB [Methylococcaceae bacterium]